MGRDACCTALVWLLLGLCDHYSSLNIGSVNVSPFCEMQRRKEEMREYVGRVSRGHEFASIMPEMGLQ